MPASDLKPKPVPHKQLSKTRIKPRNTSLALPPPGMMPPAGPAGIPKQEVVDLIFQATKDLVKKSEIQNVQSLYETMKNNEALMTVL